MLGGSSATYHEGCSCSTVSGPKDLACGAVNIRWATACSLPGGLTEVVKRRSGWDCWFK
jgi:hypothetical protein